MTSIDGLIEELSRPIYVYRMSVGGVSGRTPGQVKSARTRNQNARVEIETKIRKWVEENPSDG